MEHCASVSDKTDSSLAGQYIWNSYEELLAKSRSNDIPKSAIERSKLHAHIEILRREPYEVESAKILELAKSLLSPIRRLPPEIMSLIFWFETDETILIRRIATSASDKSNFSGFIFLLTWVCAWWREIILSQPSFWTSMMISSSSYLAIDNFETANSLLRECLLHAGSTMPFCFGVFLFDVQLSAPGLSDVLDALAGVASRWKEFRVMVPPELLHYMHDQIHPGILPVLEFLDFAVDVDAPLDRSAIPPFKTPFIHCPRLHTLNSRNASFTHDTIDLKHLVTLELSVYLCSFFAVLLEKCPLLQTFSVAHCLVPENDEAPLAVRPSRPIHHTQLKSLNFRLFRIPNEMDPWESVYLPKLTSLEIEAEDVDDATVVNRLHELKALVTRSKCVLDRITLDGDIPDDVVASFFQGIASRIVIRTPYTLTLPSSD